MMNNILKGYCEKGLSSDEGVRLKPYKDTKGILNIGIGRNLEIGITLDEAYYLFNNDLNSIYNRLEKYNWFNSLNDVRQYVLINIAFNVGVNGLLEFVNMINALKNKDYDKAAFEILNSEAAVELKNRYSNLSNIMKTGVFYV